jgi:uncharacterized RDD family membrane protein YckC
MDDAVGAGGFRTFDVSARPFAPAGWWSRVAAGALDFVVVYGGASVAIAVAGVASNTLLAAVLVAVLVGVVLYAPLMLALADGRTLGKRAVGIRVECADGEAIGLGRALVRELVAKTLLLAVVPFLGILDVLWPLVQSDNRALHDLMCGTRVVEV